MKGRSRGIDYLRPLKLFFHKNMSFNWINLLLSGLLPSLVLMIVPFFLRNNTFKATLITYDCTAHQDKIARRFDENFIEEIWKAVRTLYWIQASRFNHQLFQEFLKKQISCNRNVTYDSEDSWLSMCKVLERFCNFSHETILFLRRGLHVATLHATRQRFH